MKWEVKGVDEKAGTDRIIVIEAADEAAAQAQANYNGMLVESVMPAGNKPLDYRSPATATIGHGSDRTASPVGGTAPVPVLKSVIRQEEGRMTWSEWIGTGLCGAVGMVAIVLNGSVVFDTGHHFRRFESDNAIGATANALEHIVVQLECQHREQWLLIGIMMLVVASLIRLRAAVRRHARGQT